jgi:hypothetical protein
MDASLLIFYIVTTVIVQSVAVGMSRAVDYQYPAAGLMTLSYFRSILCRLADCGVHF